jgi:hypothetical protein
MFKDVIAAAADRAACVAAPGVARDAIPLDSTWCVYRIP